MRLIVTLYVHCCSCYSTIKNDCLAVHLPLYVMPDKCKQKDRVQVLRNPSHSRISFPAPVNCIRCLYENCVRKSICQTKRVLSILLVILGAFSELRKAPVRVLSVRLSACISAAATGRRGLAVKAQRVSRSIGLLFL